MRNHGHVAGLVLREEFAMQATPHAPSIQSEIPTTTTTTTTSTSHEEFNIVVDPPVVDQSNKEDIKDKNIKSYGKISFLKTSQKTNGNTDGPPWPVTRSIVAPCMVNGQKIYALIDSGAEISFISLTLVHELNLTVLPSAGTLQMAMQGMNVKRIGRVADMELWCGKYKIRRDMEILDMEKSINAIIGMDLFQTLNIQIINVPTQWPDVINDSTMEIFAYPLLEFPAEAIDESDTPPPEVHEDLVEAWKPLIAINQAISPSSRCNLDGAILYLDTGTAHPIFKRPYPNPIV
jgi:hypothetical protein